MKRIFILVLLVIASCAVQKRTTRILSEPKMVEIGPDVSKESIRAIEILNDSVLGIGTSESVILYRSGNTFEGAEGRSGAPKAEGRRAEEEAARRGRGEAREAVGAAEQDHQGEADA